MISELNSAAPASENAQQPANESIFAASPSTFSALEQASLEQCHSLGRIPLQFLRWNPNLIADSNPRAFPTHLRLFKRVVDIVGAAVLGLLILPFLPLIAWAIKRDSRGPVFYSQERLGQHGHVFRMHKFRSMQIDAEATGAQFATTNDARVTSFGRMMRRTRIDEIPQLWNVLKGDMSLVGPRPERPEIAAATEDQLPEFSLRLAVKPGLTGWAQTSYGYAGTLDELRTKLEFDLYYIRFASVWMDLLIALRTVKVILGFKGQ